MSNEQTPANFIDESQRIKCVKIMLKKKVKSFCRIGTNTLAMKLMEELLE